MLPERYNNHLTTYLKKSEYKMAVNCFTIGANVSKGKGTKSWLITYLFQFYLRVAEKNSLIFLEIPCKTQLREYGCQL